MRLRYGDMIPKIVEVRVKPFLFDVCFKVDSIVEEGGMMRIQNSIRE
jgi:hypothetical protein